jgi:hypothetical protein
MIAQLGNYVVVVVVVVVVAEWTVLHSITGCIPTRRKVRPSWFLIAVILTTILNIRITTHIVGRKRNAFPLCLELIHHLSIVLLHGIFGFENVGFIIIIVGRTR